MASVHQILACSRGFIQEMTPKENILLIAPGREFLIPYFEREFEEYNVVTDKSLPYQHTVAVCAPGEDRPASEADATVLICPNIVGTGMTGMPMEMARRILRLRHFHVDGNEARMATIHATDVARAARAALGVNGSFVVTDLATPSWHDFAEAIAYRLGDKRIYTLSPFWARFVMGRKWYDLITTEAQWDGREFAERFDFKPTPVTEYLRNHVYDESSL